MTYRVPLGNNRGYALVDDADREVVSRYAWHLSSNGYAIAHDGQQRIRMHRFLIGAKHGSSVDHRDGNPLNNTRANLRPCTHAQNLANQRKTRGISRYKGVRWRAGRQGWFSEIKIGGRTRYLGAFATEEGAARAYDVAAVSQYGEFARPNFPTIRDEPVSWDSPIQPRLRVSRGTAETCRYGHQKARRDSGVMACRICICAAARRLRERRRFARGQQQGAA